MDSDPPMDATLPSQSKAGLKIADGEQIGEYVVTGILGEGGFGVVYSAQHPLIGKKVAIKVLSLRYSVDPEILSRFISEARAVNQIRNEHIIDIFAFGELPDQRRYYVMEHLDGLPLDEHLKESGALSAEEAAGILMPVARALDAAHATGIAHRDLKPANIFLAWRENGWYPKLLDFGIAKLMGDQHPKDHQTQTGAAVGTPFYMSPEQCLGREVDHRTDHYAFGVMAYQMLSGELPFTAGTTVEILMKHINEEPPTLSSKLSVTSSVEQGILRLMAKLPEERPAKISDAVRSMFPELGLGTSTLTPPPRRDSLGAVAMASPGITEFPVSHDVAQAVGKSWPRWLGAIMMVLALVAVGGVWMSRQGADVEAVVVPEPAPPGEASAEPPPLEVPKPATVSIEFTGLPKGTQIARPDGTSLGAPPVRLARGAKAVVLVVSAPGYESRKIEVVPDQDHSKELSMVKKVERKRRRRRQSPPPPPPAKKSGGHRDEIPTWE